MVRIAMCLREHNFLFARVRVSTNGNTEDRASCRFFFPWPCPVVAQDIVSALFYQLQTQIVNVHKTANAFLSFTKRITIHVSIEVVWLRLLGASIINATT